MQLVDVVNLNADASCLSAAGWLAALEGGAGSAVCRWLGGYVEQRKKVSLGVIGATAADLAVLNPEAIALIGDHPEIFELLQRPFSHDVSLLRTPRGFDENVRLGRRVLERAFGRLTMAYLPPEFMLTAAQVMHLGEGGTRALFINASRFRPEVAARIPTVPHTITGVLGTRLPCLPLSGGLSRAYLDSFHRWDDTFSRAVLAAPAAPVGCWRDGEGVFFQPRGVEREHAWLAGEAKGVERVHVRDVLPTASFDVDGGSYPVHSFSEWVKEFRMFGYLRRLHHIEERLHQLSRDELVVWLLAAGSDVLSAVEKDSPRVKMRPSADEDGEVVEVLLRTNRGFEGEEFLAVLDGWGTPAVAAHLADGPGPHMAKLRARLRYVRSCA